MVRSQSVGARKVVSVGGRREVCGGGRGREMGGVRDGAMVDGDGRGRLACHGLSSSSEPLGRHRHCRGLSEWVRGCAVCFYRV